MGRKGSRIGGCGRASGRVTRTSDHPRLRLLLWLASALTVTTPACTIGRYYTGTPLQAEPSTLVEGQSTKHDVLRQFGPPTTIMHQTGGDAFVYTYQQENTSTLRVQDPVTGINWFTYSRDLNRRDTLLVIFDFAGVVRSVAIDHRIEEMPPL